MKVISRVASRKKNIQNWVKEDNSPKLDQGINENIIG
jgi:hypothetical protein